MNHFRKIIRTGMLIMTFVIISACNVNSSTPAAAPSTPDLSIVRTEAVQTAMAELTSEAQSNPTQTTVPPPDTATPLPPTEEPTQTPLPTLTVFPTPTKSSSGGGGGNIYPTQTSSYVDQATLVAQSPADYTYIKPGGDFDGAWTFKNTGRRAWNKQFYIKWKSGNLKSNTSDLYFLPKDVPVNDTIQMTADFIAPKDPGTYTSNWVLINDDGVAFSSFYIVINVK
jgi:hypothetical protein